MLPDHHDWVRYAANQLKVSGETLWQAMCAEWSDGIGIPDARAVVDPIADVLP
jgi:hypothetical protein